MAPHRTSHMCQVYHTLGNTCSLSMMGDRMHAMACPLIHSIVAGSHPVKTCTSLAVMDM